jgi:DSF synthase
MENLPNQIDVTEDDMSSGNGEFMASSDATEALVIKSATQLSIDPDLYELQQLDVLYRYDDASLWTFMRPPGRPSFTPAMLHDFEAWQRLIGENFGPDLAPLRYLVLGSRSPGVWCYGGDLELFQQLIRAGERQGLVRYGYRCVEILHRNMHALDLPMLTIGLVQGAALGGGFEALLSFDHIIAERNSTFGLPEIMFGLFPGMGAHAILSRKLGSAMADRLILSNEIYSAQQMYDMGLVQQVVEEGEGVQACKDFIKRSERRLPGLINARRAMKLTRPLPLEELKQIVDLWADAALQLSETDLKVMNRLARAQRKVAEAA